MPTTFPRLLMVVLGVTALAVSATAQPPASTTKPAIASPAGVGLPPYSPFGGQSGGFGGGTGFTTTRGGFFPLGQSADPLTQKLYAEEMGLSQEADRLARQLFDAKTDADKEKVKARLSEALEKQFDARQKRHEGEIAALEAQMKKLRELVSKRQENRRDIVTRRLNGRLVSPVLHRI